MSNIAWLPEERLEAYRTLQDFGFTGLEFAPGLLFHGAEDPFSPSPVIARRALDEVGTAGLELISMQSLLFGVPGAALFGDQTARAAFDRAMTRAINLAGQFGVPNCVFGSPAQRVIPSDMCLDRARDDAAEIFTLLGDRAAAAGTKLAIEPNPAAYGTNFLNTIEEACAFIEKVGHPAIVPILDLGAMHMNQAFDQSASYVPALLPSLNHVHVSEAELATAPAIGTDLPPLLRALANHGYDKSISIEMKRPSGGLDEVREAVSRLADAYERAEVAHA